MNQIRLRRIIRLGQKNNATELRLVVGFKEPSSGHRRLIQQSHFWRTK